MQHRVFVLRRRLHLQHSRSGHALSGRVVRCRSKDGRRPEHLLLSPTGMEWFLERHIQVHGPCRSHRLLPERRCQGLQLSTEGGQQLLTRLLAAAPGLRFSMVRDTVELDVDGMGAGGGLGDG